MNEQKNSFLYIGEDGKADWGVPEGYPYKDGVTIEWDGNTEGLDAVGGMFYRVSDIVLSDEQIKMGTVKVSNGREMHISAMWDAIANKGFITDDFVFIIAALFVRKDNISFQGFNFKKAGVYANYVEGEVYLQSFITKIIRPISTEFLPTNIGAGSFIINVTMDENENYIADKTYSEISEALVNGQIPYCIFGSAVFYLMESEGLLTTYFVSTGHYFLNIDPVSFDITTITINDQDNIIFNNPGTITVTTK